MTTFSRLWLQVLMLAALVCGILILITPSAVAEQPALEVNIPTICVSEQLLQSEIIKNYPDEKPVIMGMSTRILAETNKSVHHPLVILLDQKTGTFTILEKIEELYCMLSSGKGASLVVPDGI